MVERQKGMTDSEKWYRSRASQGCIALLGLLAMLILCHPALTQTARPVAYVVPIAGIIDLGLPRSYSAP